MNSGNLVKVFIAGFFLSSCIILPDILDLTLSSRYVTAALTCCISFLVLSRTPVRPALCIDPIITLFFLYTFYCCLSVSWALNKGEAFFAAGRTVISFSFFLLATILLKKDYTLVDKIVKLSIVLCSVLLAAGIYQLCKAGTLNKEAMYMVTGLNGHKNLFASFLFLHSFFLISAIKNQKGYWKIAAITLTMLVAVMIILLRTKAVFMAIGLGVILSTAGLLLSRYKTPTRPWVHIAIVLIAVNVFMYFVLPLILQRIDDPAAPNGIAALDQERIILWQKTYITINKNLLLGTGAGNWQVHFPDATLTGLYRAEDLNYTFQRPHNDLLWIISETGIIGFNLFCLCILIIIYFLKVLKSVNEKPDLLLKLIPFFITGCVVISFFDFPMERIEHTLWFGMLLAIARHHIIKNNLLPVYEWFPQPYIKFIQVIPLVVLMFGILRIKGEFYTRKMLDSKNSSQPGGVVKWGNKALNPLYTIDPMSVPINWYTGNAHALMGNYASAREDLEKASRYNPYNRNVLNDLGSAYVHEGKTLLSKKYYEEAARISPRFDDPKLNLAAVYIAEKNYAAAGTWLARVLHDSERRKNYQVIVDLNTNK